MPKFTTVRFGELEYHTRDEIFLPDGLVGMASLKRWLILDMGEELPMKYFQSLDRGDFGFPITQPYFYHDEYQVKLSRNVRDKLGNQHDDNLTTLIITTVHPGGNMVTGNLLAPLVIDAETRRGVQLTLDDEKFSIRQEINYFKFGLAVQPEASDNVAPEGQELESSAQKAEESEDHAQAKAGAATPETVGV